MLSCRLLPYAVADGPHNMAADETLLGSAASGVASLRFYGWSAATLSLGYFQSERVRHVEAGLAALPYVRRPSGGGTLVHHYELTYALALPAGPPWHTEEPWPGRLHRLIALALRELGVEARLHVPVADESCPGCLCFQHFTTGDLLLGESKVTGSAQRRQRGALLQHGAVLLAASPYTPSLSGIRELTGRELVPGETAAAILRAVRHDTGWGLSPADWTEAERRRCRELTATRYTQDQWNHKR